MASEVVITGCGAVTPAGVGVGRLWEAMLAGRSLAKLLTQPDFRELPLIPAATVPALYVQSLIFPESRVASLMALAAQEAVEQAGWNAATLSDVATGLSAATSKGDPARFGKLFRRFRAGALDGQANAFPLTWPDGPADLLRRRFHMTGPAVCPVAACATGNHALIRAVQMIRDGDVTRALVVAGDASITPLMVGAFARMGVLSADACRPFDRARDGFVLGEGAAAVTLELADRAIGRPLAVVAGYLLASDAAGLTGQDASGTTLAGAIERALDRSGMRANRVGLYSAHATATRSNDLAESSAIGRVFGRPGPPLVAAKGVLGHLLGAAGLAELVIAVQAMRHSLQPPLANLRTLDEDCPVRVPPTPTPQRVNASAALAVSAGFGGQLGLVALTRPA